MEDLATPSQFAGLVRRLHLGHRLLRSHLAERLAGLEMSETDFLVLGACDRAGEASASQGSLASLVGLSPAQLSALVERLRQRGWLDVRRCRSDRRKQLLSVTDVGREQLQRAIELIQQGDRDLVPGFDATHRRTLSHCLDQLIEACETSTASSTANDSVSDRGAAA